MQRTLLLLLVAASYLLFAGRPPWTLTPLLALALLGVLVAPRRAFTFPRAFRWLDAALIALALCTVFQLVPIPGRAAAILSPNADRVRTALAFAGAGDGPSQWTTLSIDRGATLVALGNIVLGILSFWIARSVFAAGGNTRRFCRVLALFGALMAVLALVQRAVTPRMVLFILEPEARSATAFGAFVNRNHFAAWLLLVTGPVIGYLIAHFHIHPVHRNRWRTSVRQFFASDAVLTAAATVTTVGVLFATLSRSAVAGLGAAALSGWRLGRHRMRVERTHLPAALGLAGAALLAAVFFIDVDAWAVRLQESLSSETGALSRIAIWRETVPIIGDFWLTGTGAGTYSDAMTQYQQSRVWVGSMQRWAHFNNAHSHYLQVATEGGLLLAIPAAAALLQLLTLGRLAVRADTGEMFWVRAGAAASLAGLAVQSVWEVALVMPANAVLCGVLAGLLLYQRDLGGYEPSSPGDFARSSTPSRVRVT